LTQFEVSVRFPVAPKTNFVGKRKKTFSNDCQFEGYLKLRQSEAPQEELPHKGNSSFFAD